jgi:hypothetical protein
MHATAVETATSMRRTSSSSGKATERRVIPDVAPERCHGGMHEDPALDR